MRIDTCVEFNSLWYERKVSALLFAKNVALPEDRSFNLLGEFHSLNEPILFDMLGKGKKKKLHDMISSHMRTELQHGTISCSTIKMLQEKNAQ